MTNRLTKRRMCWSALCHIYISARRVGLGLQKRMMRRCLQNNEGFPLSEGARQAHTTTKAIILRRNTVLVSRCKRDSTLHITDHGAIISTTAGTVNYHLCGSLSSPFLPSRVGISPPIIVQHVGPPLRHVYKTTRAHHDMPSGTPPNNQIINNPQR